MTVDLEDRLHALSEAQPFKTAWSLYDIKGDRHLSWTGNRAVPAGSTRKIAILMACLSVVAERRLDLDRRIVIEPRHQENDSGLVRFLKPYLSLTLHDALTLMIVVSDNSCTLAVTELLGFDRVIEWSEATGLSGMRHVASAPANSYMNDPTPSDLTQTNTTTADDMSRLLRLILFGATNKVVAAQLRCTPALCHLALDILSWQQYRTSIPKLLPIGTKVAHKTGVGPSHESDAGIVFSDDGPLFVLACYTRDIPPIIGSGIPGRALAKDFIGNVSAACWSTLMD